MTEPAAATTQHRFQAEVAEVLSLVVNSLYTHKEVYLRELISNASDAIDQLAFRALQQPDLVVGPPEWRIDIVPDREARTLTIRDNGAGMDDADLVQNLGTIAHSGTKKLLESLSGDQRKDLTLIGQFGVGFYSAFLVADRVTVVTRKAGGDGRAWKWSSDGKSGFTLEPGEREGRGTDVVLHMKETEADFLREWTLRELVKKYSDFVRHPIRLEVERGQDDKKHKEMEQVNKGAALWTRPKSEITDEAADDFYRHVSRDWEAPLAWTHFRTEGMQEMTGLLFIPGRAPPFDTTSARRKGVRLFVRRIFIMDDCEEILPEYLRFVRGVVDSDDLPLNVSREFLQRDRVAAGIRKQVVRQVLKLLEDLAAEGPRPVKKSEDDADAPAADVVPDTENRYEHFWREHGRILTEGVVSDSDNAERITKLLRFQSSHAPGLTGLTDYRTRMPEAQPAIYYVVADSRESAARSPHAEAIRKRGWEVLYLTEPVEEWVLQQVPEFDGKKLVSASSGKLDLPEDDAEKAAHEKLEGEFAPLVGRVKGALESSVEDVRVSSRLTDSPACLVAGDQDVSPQMARILKSQDRNWTPPKRVLELNPAHAVIQRLNTLAGDASNADRVNDMSALLYDQALVAEGSAPSDPARFARQIAELLTKSLAD
ncbi:MAG: molecular chaperone HtpG [Planctomycetes bacterium]|nr:molecular chaperone HtpG [Planctomycetota bacterium]